MELEVEVNPTICKLSIVPIGYLYGYKQMQASKNNFDQFDHERYWRFRIAEEACEWEALIYNIAP